MLRQHARHYIGLELSFSAIAGARKRYGDDCALVNGNAERLPFADSSFDAVFLNDMLAYCDKPGVMSEVARVLRPGGRAVSLHNNSAGWSFYKLRYPEKPAVLEWLHSAVVLANTFVRRLTGWRPFHTTFNTRADLVEAVLDAGLSLDSVWSTRKAYRWWHFIARKQDFPCARPRPVALLTGSYLSQNMGAAAMTIVANERLRNLGYDCVLLAKYPHDDAPFASRYGVKLQEGHQLAFTFGVIPLLLLLLPFIGVRRWIRAVWFHDAVLCYDLGGITFASSRGAVGFVINATWTLLPLLLDMRLVKGSQAMGPFDRWYLRVAPPLLRRATSIHARGADTLRHLRRERIRARLTPDIAFLLPPEEISTPMPGFVALVPSSVVRQRIDGVAGEGTYLALFAALARHLIARGRRVLILAHSYRSESTENSNDWPLCQRLAETVSDPGLSLHPSPGCTPGELKYVLGKADAVVTSRFHGMVAALSMGVPVLVTSWSHKYREVLEMFDMERWALDWRKLDESKLITTADALLDTAADLRETIAKRLPNVRQAAEANFEGLPPVPSR